MGFRRQLANENRVCTFPALAMQPSEETTHNSYAPFRANLAVDPTSHSNALLQMLFVTKSFRRYIVENSSFGALHLDMANAFVDMYVESNKTNSKGIVWNEVNSQITEQLLSEVQFPNAPFVDAHSALMHVFDMLIKESNKAPRVIPPDPKSAEEAWRSYRKFMNDSPLANLFTIMLATKHSYPVCGHKHRKINFSNFLALDVSKNFSSSVVPSSDQVPISNSLSNYLEDIFTEVSVEVPYHYHRLPLFQF